MKILAFSDIHFWKKSAETAEQALCEGVCADIRAHKPDLVVFGGDLNHTHNSVDTDVLHAMARAMATVARTAVEVTGRKLVAISGNHDTALRGMHKNIVEAMAELCGDIEAHTKPAYIEDADLLLVPYPPADEEGADDFAKRVARIGKDNQPKNALVHVELADIRYSPASSHTTEHPFILPESVKTILAGHYHHPESREVGGRMIHVIGSPLYHNYSDQIVDIPRGWLMLEDGNVTRLTCSYGPVFHTIRGAQAADFEGSANCNLRVRVADKDEYIALRDEIGRLRGTCKSVQVIGQTTEVSQALYKEETNTLDITKPDEVYLEFVKKNNLSERVAAAGREFLTQVIK